MRHKSRRRARMGAARQVFADVRTQTAIGLVVKPPDEAAHWLRDEANRVLCFVELKPTGGIRLCVLGGVCKARGVVSVPPPGTQVGIVIPDGRVGAEPRIVERFDDGQEPLPELDDETLVVVGPRVAVIARADQVYLGAIEGAVPVALGPPVESQFAALRSHRHTTSTGITSQAILMSQAYLEQYPDDPDDVVIPNPPHMAGPPYSNGHVHGDPEPTTLSGPMSGGGVGATKVRAV